MVYVNYDPVVVALARRVVPKHQWRPVTGEAAADTPNIQWGAVGRKS